MEDTMQLYDKVFQNCRELFVHKTADYGTSWRVLRMISIADQLYIKAQRIRTIQALGRQKIADGIDGEFKAIVNYGVIGLVQLGMQAEAPTDLSLQEASTYFDEKTAHIRRIMMDKNHDYGEAWRDMSVEGITDLILMKILRIRQILANDGKTLVSEGIDSNLVDIVNYALFALILRQESSNHLQEKFPEGKI